MRPRGTQIRIRPLPHTGKSARSLYHSVFTHDAVLSRTARPAASEHPAEE